MAIKTTQERIEELDSIISNILLGQEVTQNGKTWKGPDLDVLVRYRNQLSKCYRAENGGGLSVNAGRLSRE